jgi:hypothetical protein
MRRALSCLFSNLSTFNGIAFRQSVAILRSTRSCSIDCLVDPLIELSGGYPTSLASFRLVWQNVKIIEVASGVS